MKTDDTWRRLFGGLAVVVLTAFSTPANADDRMNGNPDVDSAASFELITLKPRMGKIVELPGVAGSVYYTAEGTGYRIVSTLSSTESVMPFRFVATLTDGQKIFLHVPRQENEAPAEMMVERVGETVNVLLPRAPRDIPSTRTANNQTRTIN